MFITTIQDATIASAMEEIAQTIGIPAYLVGGASRDAIAGITPRDFDIVVEGGWAQQAATRFGVEVATFGFPTPRAYQVRPEINGATFEVEFINSVGSVDEDMGRRDFTCNAFAIPISAFAQAMATGQEQKVDLQ